MKRKSFDRDNTFLHRKDLVVYFNERKTIPFFIICLHNTIKVFKYNNNSNHIAT